MLSAIATADPSASVSYAYDSAGRQISETSNLFGTSNFVLDRNGNRIKLTLPSIASPFDGEVSYVYDSLNRITDIYEDSVSTGERIANYSYDVLGRRDAISYGGITSPVATTNISYNVSNLPASVGHAWNGSPGAHYVGSNGNSVKFVFHAP